MNRLLRLTSIAKADHVIEIGAGKGHITRHLAAKCGKLTAVEIDPLLCAHLRGKLTGCQNLTLINGDFLKLNLPSKPYKVFANLPFSITTDIMRKLFAGKNPPEEAWLVMEKGAAKRFCGSPKESLLSLLMKPEFDLQVAYHFRREDFHPMPSVDCVMLHVQRKQTPDILPQQRRAYEDFIGKSMKQGLFGQKALLAKRQIATALRQANLPQIEESGTVLYVQWLCLFQCYWRLNK